MGDRDARYPAQTLAQLHRHLLHAEFAGVAIYQAHVHAGVHFALGIARVDGGQGVAYFRKRADNGLNLSGALLGDFKR